jgi:hypothetical protein
MSETPNPALIDPYPSFLANVDLSADCEDHGHVFGLITGSVRHCERYGCPMRDALDPDEFTDPFGGLYDWDDPDRTQLGYYGPDAYVLKII